MWHEQKVPPIAFVFDFFGLPYLPEYWQTMERTAWHSKRNDGASTSGLQVVEEEFIDMLPSPTLESDEEQVTIVRQKKVGVLAPTNSKISAGCVGDGGVVQSKDCQHS